MERERKALTLFCCSIGVAFGRPPPVNLPPSRGKVAFAEQMTDEGGPGRVNLSSDPTKPVQHSWPGLRRRRRKVRFARNTLAGISRYAPLLLLSQMGYLPFGPPLCHCHIFFTLRPPQSAALTAHPSRGSYILWGAASRTRPCATSFCGAQRPRRARCPALLGG